MGDLPEIMENRTRRPDAIGYPALADAGEAGHLQVFHSPRKAREIHRGECGDAGRSHFRPPFVTREDAARDVALGPLKADVVTAALERTFLSGALPITQADFARPR